ncbi:transcription factor MYB1, putative [Plasmodium chabaudi chabaudi]|uniref:Transcription factor MYB1, putative n=1 Tax=Plasmodium chabaudi chabaudi TaxID=31271 RepID=A0A4V0KDB7_PLACU|nr:transcription factor MYB1, putative [Plasmodium chabaudi chabaudi]VTZ70838.1 transcription factor MYB1, putative [Plasmodium chabaudi chabaudi]|eukprot:XP_744437.2 Myb1 protein, putative [Plasmodium chabaudi chabaudi]
MNRNLGEYENLSILEEKLEKHLQTVNKLISHSRENIEKLDDYINTKYNEIKQLAKKRPTRINWIKDEEKTHMSIFFDREFGLIPSNEDALKMLQFESNNTKYRKKYEFKKNDWTKKDIEILFKTVDELSKKYAIHYLIDPNLPYELKMEKKKEIENDKDVKNIFNKIKLHFDSEIKHEANLITKEIKNNNTEIGNSEEKLISQNDINNKLGINSFPTFLEMFWNDVSQNVKNSQNSIECQKTWLYQACFEDDKQKKWSDDEIKKLLQLAKKYDERQWKNIARELNTNRSPLSCFQQYIKIKKIYETKEKNTLERIAFNALEDIQLQILVSIIGDKNWGEIKKHMESLNSNTHRISTRKSPKESHKNKQKKNLNDEISYKRRYLRLVKKCN